MVEIIQSVDTQVTNNRGAVHAKLPEILERNKERERDSERESESETERERE